MKLTRTNMSLSVCLMADSSNQSLALTLIEGLHSKTTNNLVCRYNRQVQETFHGLWSRKVESWLNQVAKDSDDLVRQVKSWLLHADGNVTTLSPNEREVCPKQHK